ncbi:MAG TPA: magnesium transporter [Dehalococcoidia bacterium]|nr:magnesium transporter [Dehalococcoidia bacterium]
MTTEPEGVDPADRIEELLGGDDAAAAAELLEGMHPADQADLYDRLDDPERETMLALLSNESRAELLEHLDEDTLEEIVERMPRVELARVLDLTKNDIAADVLRLLPPAEATRILAQMTTASDVTPLLVHPDESAGGLMTRGYVALHKDMSVGEAVNFLRARKPLAEEAYYLYVLDTANHLEGVVNLRELVVSDPETRIEDVMTRDVVSVRPDADQEEAANLLQHYRLRAIPVVDESGTLSGIITSDDIIDVITEEATEDIYQIVGLPADESVYAPLAESVRRRLPWLFINLLTAFAGVAVVAAFQGTIEKAAALAVFMPIVAGQGGNAGIQTITIIVRGIAVGEIELRDAQQVLWREIGIGVIKGVAIGTVVGLVAWVTQGGWAWGFVVGFALIGNMAVAGAFGALIPLTLRSVHLDPALASGIFLTMITDAMGFLFLLGLATIMIGELT